MFSKKLSITNVKYYLQEGDRFIENGDLDEAKEYYAKISELGKYLEDEGMPLAYHHHIGTVIETQNDGDWEEIEDQQ